MQSGRWAEFFARILKDRKIRGDYPWTPKPRLRFPIVGGAFKDFCWPFWTKKRVTWWWNDPIWRAYFANGLSKLPVSGAKTKVSKYISSWLVARTGLRWSYEIFLALSIKTTSSKNTWNLYKWPSIFEGQPPKTRPKLPNSNQNSRCPIWVPFVYKKNGTLQFLRWCFRFSGKITLLAILLVTFLGWLSDS